MIFRRIVSVKNLFILFCFVSLFTTAWVIYAVAGSEELGRKPEWSAVQSYEYHNRESLIDDGKFIIKTSDSGLEVIGILDSKKEQNVWILLNSKYKPFVKTLPENLTLTISSEMYIEIVTSHVISLEVRKYLSEYVVY